MRFSGVLAAVIVVVAIVFGLTGREPAGVDESLGRPEGSIADGGIESGVIPAGASFGRGGGGTDPGNGQEAATAESSGAPDQPAPGDDQGLVPIPVPADFVQVFERNQELADFHAALERESEDTAWAQELEGYFTSHFNDTLDLSEWLVQSIECRSNSCEILATGYGDDAMRSWMQSLSDLFEDEAQFEALVGGTGEASCGGGDLAPGVIAVSCTIRRTGAEADAGIEEPETELYSLDTPYPEGVDVARVPVPDSIAPAIQSDQEVFDLHRQLEQESIDYAWAGYADQLITDFMSGIDPERGLSLAGVTCRETLCEVQLVARDEETAMVEWVSTMLDFMRSNGQELIPAGSNDATFGDGDEIGIVWFLERTPANAALPDDSPFAASEDAAAS